MYFQNEPSANPLRLLVNSRVGGHMLVNLKNVSKTSALLNNNNNNGLNLPVTGAAKTKWDFYGFQPYPSKAIPNMQIYKSTVSSVKLSPQCLHALHVFQHGLHYCITTQVERMSQTIIRMIGKLEKDKKACWSEHLPELLMAYNATHSAVTGYSPYYLLFGRRPRIPVDYLFPTLHDSPHQTKMEVSVVAMQKRLKEAFAVARHLTSEEVAKQCQYYDRKAGAVALQPGDVVMVLTDGFVGKWKVKDRWEDGGFIVESQLENWPVYKVKCPTSDAQQKPKYWILHRNCLLLVTNEDASDIPGQAQAKVTPTVSNATPEAFSAGVSLLEKLQPSLVTRQGGGLTSGVWLNGKIRMKPWTQMVPEATQTPPASIEDEVSEPKSAFSDSEPEGM